MAAIMSATDTCCKLDRSARRRVVSVTCSSVTTDLGAQCHVMCTPWGFYTMSYNSSYLGLMILQLHEVV